MTPADDRPDLAPVLSRIADALERMAPQPTRSTDWVTHPAYVWSGVEARAVDKLEAPALDLLRGVDSQKERVVSNVGRHAAGLAAHDMLLWGSRGMGKSALVRAAIRNAQTSDKAGIALVQVAQEALPLVTRLFTELAGQSRQFLVFIDDLGFDEDDVSGPRLLRSWLEGGVEARPANVRLVVTSNRRAIVTRTMSEQDDTINARDAVDDKLALADRFGLSIGFHNCSQADYLAIVGGYTEALGLVFTEADAIEWAARRGARSGRIAWQFITELAGRAGKMV